MKGLLMRALDLARLRGANYADARVVNHREENLAIKDGVVEALLSSETEGIGVRVPALKIKTFNFTGSTV